MTISATVICDSIGERAPRLTTFQLRYPRFIHAEFMTHRVFSRNASSSRAIPTDRLIRDVLDDPVYPMHWGKNISGMQANEECNSYVHRYLSREEAWEKARDEAISSAQAFAEAGYHKQIVNRLLEPFSHINVLVTATQWSNFFALRMHKAAQPELRALAHEMHCAMQLSTPRRLGIDEWHLPYVSLAQGGWHDPDDMRPILQSVARCARVSYLTQDGKASTLAADLHLAHRLLGEVPLHASPAEHQAKLDQWMQRYNHGEGCWLNPELCGNLGAGWIQYRKTLEGENVDG